MEDSEELKIYVKMAKTRIASLYHDTSGACYLSFSGGKDSTVVLALIKECIEEGLILSEIPAVYADTKIEFKATKEFVAWVKEHYYRNVVVIDPQKTFPEIIVQHGKPMLSKLKSHVLKSYQNNPACKSSNLLIYDIPGKRNSVKIANKDLHILHPDFDIKISEKCCDYMKKGPSAKYAKQSGALGYLTGLRASEGGARKVKYEGALASGKSPCTSFQDGKIVKSPIIDWDDNILYEFICNHEVPLSKAYTEYGCDRTGCFLCPYSSDVSRELEIVFVHEPNQYQAAITWMKDVYIAQNIVLPFDKEYEREREETWRNKYSRMRYEMLLKYRPDCKLVKEYEKPEQLSFFEGGRLR